MRLACGDDQPEREVLDRVSNGPQGLSSLFEFSVSQL